MSGRRNWWRKRVALEGLRSVVAGAAMLFSVGSMYDCAFCTKLEMLNIFWAGQISGGLYFGNYAFMLHCAEQTSCLTSSSAQVGDLCRAGDGGVVVLPHPCTDPVAEVWRFTSVYDIRIFGSKVLLLHGIHTDMVEREIK